VAATIATGATVAATIMVIVAATQWKHCNSALVSISLTNCTCPLGPTYIYIHI